MEEEFIPRREARLLKKIGLEQKHCFAFWIDISTGTKSKPYINLFTSGNRYSDNIVWTPTWYTTFKWFRDNHQLYGEIGRSKKSGWYYFGSLKGEDCLTNGPYEDYEIAQLACINKLIDIVIKRKE